MSNASEQQIYLKYVEEFGYPPKEAKHLIVFSKANHINSPISYKNAKYVINNPPKNTTSSLKPKQVSLNDEKKENNINDNKTPKPSIGGQKPLNMHQNKNKSYDKPQFGDKTYIKNTIKNTEHPNNSISNGIQIPVTVGRSGKLNCKFFISVKRGEVMKNIITEIQTKLNIKFHPTEVDIYGIDADKSFIKQSVILDQDNYKTLSLLSIINYDKSVIIGQGLFVEAFEREKEEFEEKDDINRQILTGYLEKQCEPLEMNIFKKMKVELHGKYLKLYHGQTGHYGIMEFPNEPSEVFNLEIYTIITIINDKQFKLSSKDNELSLVFIAESVEDMNRWIKYIKFFCAEMIWTDHGKSKKLTNNEHEIIRINVHIVDFDVTRDALGGHLVICAAYIKQEIMDNILSEIEVKYRPITVIIDHIENGFTGHCIIYKAMLKTSITDWSRKEIIDKGLTVVIKPKYTHKIMEEEITCKQMKKLKSNDPLHCPIYYGMKQNYELTLENLKHMNKYKHFKDEYANKSLCQYKDDCKAYIRMENGGNELKDRCHLKLYRHPPRTRNIKLAENVHSLIFNKSKQENHILYKPTDTDKKKYGWNELDGFMNALIEEVGTNGFKYDLCLECSQSDDCKHGKPSILQIVDDKMEHIRHIAINKPLNRAQMLSLILYTGCDCNYDLCKSQRIGNYNKWKWFDYCLYHGIRILSEREQGAFSVFSGLNGVKLDTKTVSNGYFVTYVSTSWKKKVSEAFMGAGDGMIIQFDSKYKNEESVWCCDVSWISKFPDECEILFARSLHYSQNKFNCKVLDESDGIQTISLKHPIWK